MRAGAFVRLMGKAPLSCELRLKNGKKEARALGVPAEGSVHAKALRWKTGQSVLEEQRDLWSWRVGSRWNATWDDVGTVGHG